MNKRFFNQQNLTRRLRLLPVLFAMLLMPLSAWAEDYNVVIGTTQITDANMNDVLGDGGSVKYVPLSPAYTGGTLKLTNANINGKVRTNYANLTIELVGKNTIAVNDTSALATWFDAASLTFTTSATSPGSLTLTPGEYYPAIGGTGKNFQITYENGLSLNPATPTTGQTAVVGVSCGLTVGEVPVTTANASNITGTGITGTVSYDAENHKLTLNGATITGQIICSYDALTVHLIGHNTITPREGNSPFVYSNPGTGTLTFTTNENPNSSRLEAKGVTSTAALGLGYNVSNTFETRTESMIGVGVEVEDGWKVNIFKDDYNYPDQTIIWNFKNYNLFIGGVRVTSDNLEGNGYIAYNPDTHTFPVSGATQYAVKSGLEELIIEVSGEATIDASDYSTNLMPAISFDAMTGGPASGTLKFVKAADADLASITLTPSDTHKAIEGFAVDNIIVTEPLQLKSPTSMSDILNATTVTIANYNDTYGIKIAGITVTDGNKDNILGDDLSEEGSVASVSYNPETYTLTLNNATIDMSDIYAYPIESTIENLILDLKGESNITVNSSFARAYMYTGTSQSATLSLNQEAVGGATLIISGVGSLANTFEGCTFSEAWNGNDGKTGWRHEESNGMYPKVTITFLQYYDMWVNGYRLTSDNIGAMEITCQFIPETHTLKLNSYPNNGEFVSGLPELIVELSGQNNVKSFTYAGDGNGTLIFRAADPDASANIEIENVDNNQETPVYGPAISGFNTVTVETPLKVLTPQEAPGNWNTYNNKVVIGINSYDLYVAGVLVREDNASNVLGDNLPEGVSVGSVSYDATTNTLTLNNASIIPDHELVGITYEGEENLTIKLIGTNNTIKGVGGCSAIAYYGNSSPSLTFTKGDTQACSVQLQSLDDCVIDNFAADISHDGLYMLDEVIQGADQNTIYRTTFTSTLLSGGTGTSNDPFLIKTKEDLAAFANYVNNGAITTQYVNLDNNINCSELTGFMPIGTSDHPFTGTFTNSDNYTISNLNCTTPDADGYIGLFGVVGLNGATSVAGNVSGLKLDNCSFSGGTVGGAIAGYLSCGTISNCLVTNCSVTTNSGVAPTSAGIAGESFGTITNCTVSGSTITASTTAYDASTTAGGIAGTNGGTISGCEVIGSTAHPTLIKTIYDNGTSGADRQAGGIVGNSIDDSSYTITISGNSVKGVTTVNSEDSEGNAQAGAIIGHCPNNSNFTLDNNFYEYTVKTIIKNYGVTDERTGYQQRGYGDYTYDEQTQTNVYTDITANNGAVMYTKKLTLTDGVSYEGVDSYEPLSTPTNGIFALAPDQNVEIDLFPAAGKSISAVSLVYTPTGGTEQTVNLDNEAEDPGYYSYSFKMPNANATLNVTYNEYDLWIGDTQVTVANKDHILGEGNTTVTFAVVDGVNTLTLNGAALTVPVKVGMANLTIDIQGTNSITTSERCIQKIDNTTPAVTFKSTSTEVGSLSLNGSTGVYGVGYGTFSINDQFAVVLFKDDRYYSNQYWFTDGSTTKALLTPSYGLTVGGMQIGEGNAADITGEGIGDGSVDASGMVSFNKETNTLTLNNASLSGVIRSSLPNLTIDLVGNNSIYSGGDCTLQAGVAVNMTIQSTAETKGTLTMNRGTTAGNFNDDNVTVNITEPLAVISGSMTNATTAVIGVSCQLNVSFSTSNEWATYYGSENLATPEGLKAYQVTAVEGATVTISEIIGYIPANTAVLLKNVSNNNTWSNIAASAYTGATSTTSTFASNKLIGTASDVDVSTISGGTVYVLYNNMFKRATGGTIPANRGYLVVATSSNAPQLSISIGDETTGIQTLNVERGTLNDDSWYTIDGRKVNGQSSMVNGQLKPGLYIKNGKKVFINKK